MKYHCFQRLLAAVFAVCMVMAVHVSAFAAEASITKVDGVQVDQLELTYVGQEITPRGRVEIYSFIIPNNGIFYELPNFRGEYTRNTVISIQGTWSPSYERISVMFQDMNTGGSMTGNVDCNEERSFALWSNSEWACFVKADSKNISGTIRMEIS